MNFDNINYPAPKQEYKVLVRCFTFNQSKYIEDALNGFAAQQTNFPFLCLVMDDASTDGEQGVINAWMERECDMSRAEMIDIPTSVVIIVPHKINVYCFFAFYFLKQNLYGIGDKKMRHVYPWRERCEYEAICEGDDYWIDPLKLQKQVDALEGKEGCGFCFTNGYVLNKGKILKSLMKWNEEGDIFTSLLYDNFILTPSVLINTKVYSICEKNIKNYKRNWLMGDYPLWLEILLISKPVFLKDYTCVYRILNESASHSKDISKLETFYKSSLDVQRFYASKAGIDDIDEYFVSNYNAKMYQIALGQGCKCDTYKTYLSGISNYYNSKILVLHYAAKFKFVDILIKIFLNSALVQSLRSLIK